ncbi:MAG: ABC transporter ATP-binding protein [Anaeromicrobium sp.]|jgi:iron(III) transport system ATP-binding protein|uniref:ABC transporter ATP-binding protein n=1 Tax=Anaeromicrobium sp. TaxID=1929132 RepID=UPI0025DC98BE|nr:ABC transporter ATP-binding protein [Anaeromicrobium sp.]MCT4595886.1 ABC transporter ATP-binding protein [Anaeromicrobium sp.]
MSQIQIENVSKKFKGKEILKNINLTIQEGELISLLGPSGCGKTTTLKIIAGLIDLDKGDILFDKVSILNKEPNKRGAVIVFQDYLLFPHMTVEENIGFGLKMAKRNKRQIKKVVNEMIELVELRGHERKYPRELSGGQRQRVAIARALAVEPKVLLLDEPFSNLDIRLRESMRQFVLDIQRRLKITTLLVTHDKEEALLCSNKVAVMLNGEIKGYDTPKNIYERPKSIDVCKFFGDRNYIEGRVKDYFFESSLGKIKVEIENKEKAICVIRPEIIKVGKYHPKGLVGHIKSIKYGGDRTYYEVKVQKILLKVIDVCNDELHVGDRVSVIIDENKILVY